MTCRALRYTAWHMACVVCSLRRENSYLSVQVPYEYSTVQYDCTRQARRGAGTYSYGTLSYGRSTYLEEYP